MISETLYSDIPSDTVCWKVNYPLWEAFSQLYQQKNHKNPNENIWSEIDVVFWLDRPFQSEGIMQ